MLVRTIAVLNKNNTTFGLTVYFDGYYNFDCGLYFEMVTRSLCLVSKYTVRLACNQNADIFDDFW